MAIPPRGTRTECVDLEPVIGLEVHCQLATESKAFCACSTRFGDPPNTNACPTCLGLPGALPSFNARALDLALRVGLALGCTIRARSVFARKNYFYPDLPKGYQISQHDRPLAEGGSMDVPRQGTGALRADGATSLRADGATSLRADGATSLRVRIERVHLEEDAGKSLHDASESSSFVDYNRSGVPLAEIVTAPDFRTSSEAHDFLVRLRQLVRWLGVSDGNMEQGSLRCDCNVSVRPRGSSTYGTRVELKNLNSFRSVVRALEHEIARQSRLVREGGTVEHGTRLWDEVREETRPLRRKEVAQDYRYFTDPDLLPVDVGEDVVARVRSSLPELPDARRLRFVEQMGLPAYDAGVLTSSRVLADRFEELARACGDAKQASKWMLGEVLRVLGERGADLESEALVLPVPVVEIAGLAARVSAGEISISAAKRAFSDMVSSGRSAAETIEALGLRQVSDEQPLRLAVRDVLAANPKAVADFHAGNARSFGFLVGQLMRATRGQANPQVANRLLEEALAGRGDRPDGEDVGGP